MQEYLREYAGKRILITGGAGCIGSNLTSALLKVGAARVSILDDLSSAEKWNVPEHPGVNFIEGSILDEEKLKRAFSDECDYVFHLAAHFANQNSVDHPETDLMVNGLGTLKVLQYSRLTKSSKFIFASSGCSVYGSQAPLPLREDFVSLKLDTPYQITKLLGELYCNFFYNYFGLSVVIGRFFNVYGPGEIPGAYRNVIPNFIYRAKLRQPLPITGSGKETRDFTFVEDVVDGLLRLGVVPGAVGEALNMASETETKVIDLANMINELTGNEKGVTFVERRSWDRIIRRKASIEKARKTLGYNPKTDMKDGIQKTINWISQHWDKIKVSAKF